MIHSSKIETTLEVLNRQRRHRPDIRVLASLFQSALLPCLACPGPEAPLLPGLNCITAVLVSNRRVAQIHRQFMGISGPTDVITFHHGEIIISADTAATEAGLLGVPLEQEIALYLVHGLLHLNGHEDATANGFETMRREQERILHQILTKTAARTPADHA